MFLSHTPHAFRMRGKSQPEGSWAAAVPSLPLAWLPTLQTAQFFDSVFRLGSIYTHTGCLLVPNENVHLPSFSLQSGSGWMHKEEV